MTDWSRQAGRKKKFLRNCAKVRADESQARMFFTAGRNKSEDFLQGRGPNTSWSASFYFIFSITVAESSERVNNRESLCISNVHAAEWGHVHKWRSALPWDDCGLFHLQWDHPRYGGSPSCRLDNAQHALCWQLLLMILSSSSLAFFPFRRPLYTRSQAQCSIQTQHSYWCKSWNEAQGLYDRRQGWNRKKVFNLPQVLINAELYDFVLAPRLEKGYHQFATLGANVPAFINILTSMF